MELMSGEEVVWRGHPSWRANIGYFVVWGLLAVAPAVIAGLLSANDVGTGLSVWQWVLISLGLVGLVVLVDLIRRLAVTYTITSRRLHIRRGILNRYDQSTHIDRVQNLNTRQSLAQRILAVGTVDFDTAGTEAEEANFRFVGITRPHALVTRVEGIRQRAIETPGGAGGRTMATGGL